MRLLQFVRPLAVTVALALPTVVVAQTATADHVAVQRAALDYLEGFYDGDSTKHIRSISPDVYKYGFERDRSTGAYSGSRMTWPEFHDFTRRVRARGRGAPAGAPKEVVIYEVLDQTASAKVIAYWGIDYLLMARIDGAWKITHILWQTPPVTAP